MQQAMIDFPVKERQPRNVDEVLLLHQQALAPAGLGYVANNAEEAQRLPCFVEVHVSFGLEDALLAIAPQAVGRREALAVNDGVAHPGPHPLHVVRVDQPLDLLRRRLNALISEEDPPRFIRYLELAGSERVAPMAQLPDPLCPIQQVAAAAELILGPLALGD